MNLRLLPFLLPLLIACLPFAAQAQRTLWFHQVGKDAGILNANQIHEVFQDSEGFTWIGSESGLDRFDGHSVKHFLHQEGDPYSIQSNRVYGGFFEDSGKNIWFCTDAGIQCYRRNDDRFSYFRVANREGILLRTGYSAIYLERDSFLWVRADNREIYRFNIHSHESSALIGRMAFDIDAFAGAAPDGSLRYIFSVDGSKSTGIQVMEIGPDRKLARSFTAFEHEPALNIHSVVFDHDTAVWLGADTGVFRWDLSSNRIHPFPTGQSSAKFIVPYGPDQLLGFELGRGIFFFDKRKTDAQPFEWVESYLIADPSADPSSLGNLIYADPRGNIWVATISGILAFANPAKTKFRSIPKYQSFNGTTNYDFRTMVQAPGGRIWCSTFFDGVFLLDYNGKLVRHYHPDLGVLPDNQVSHMLLDDAQRLWVALKDGVALYDPEKDAFLPVPGEAGRQIEYPVYLYQLRSGEILVSTLQQGVFRIVEEGNRKFLRQAMAPKDESDFLTTIYQDSHGQVYISRKMAELAIFSYLGDSLRLLATKDIPGFINGFYEEPINNTLWIATSNGLVSTQDLHNAPVISHRNEEGAQYNEIQSLAVDGEGQLWMGTSEGIVRFDPSRKRFQVFTLADGMRSRQFDNLAVLKHHTGALWFGGQDGLTIVEPRAVRFLFDRPTIQLTEIRVNDEVKAGLSEAGSQKTNVQVFEKLLLPYGDNTLSFSFTAIDYGDPQATRLEYMLEGMDEHWVPVQRGKPGFARYPNLPPGSYTLRLRAFNSDGQLSSDEKTLGVTILPPWYQTWWARSLFVLLAALLIFLVYRYRVNQIRKEEAFKRQEAEYKQLVAETETAILRLQMNPHFIFNSMNSINSYILQRNVDTASDYLHRFAQLMRRILELAARPLISVADEVDFLEQYLETEAMRFEKHFTYSFEMPDDTDPDEFLIPTMILQPFVENAIWHGLSRKEEAGHITVAFEPKHDCLICRVEDNGVGRKAAGKPSGHQSKAIGITTRRLEILEQQGKGRASVEIIDRTRVELVLPLL